MVNLAQAEAVRMERIRELKAADVASVADKCNCPASASNKTKRLEWLFVTYLNDN